MQDITNLIVTFDRPESLARLMASIRKSDPDHRTIIVDNGRKEPPLDAIADATYVRIPYRSGLSASRNFGVDLIDTPYVLLLDDDFVFTKHTDIARLKHALEHHDLDIVAGGYVEHNGDGKGTETWAGTFEHDEDARILTVIRHQNVPGFTLADMVPNFFVARTDVLRRVRWDGELVLREHMEFFWRAKKEGVKVGYDPTVAIGHCRDGDRAYRKIRSDTKHVTELGNRKMGVVRSGYRDDFEPWCQPPDTVDAQPPDTTTRRLELTVKLGCPVGCSYCPQQLLAQATVSHSIRLLTAGNLDRIIDNCTDDQHNLEVHFSGFCEPFAHPDILGLMGACEARANVERIVMYSTGIGATPADIKAMGSLEKLRGKVFWHVRPGAAIVDLIPAIAEHLPNSEFSMVGSNCSRTDRRRVEEALAVAKAAGVSEATGLNLKKSRQGTRAGNVTLQETGQPPETIARHPVCCDRVGESSMPVVLPSGATIACCMDYGGELAIGNLLIDRWEKLDFARILDLQQHPNTDCICFRGCRFAKPAKPAA